MDRLSVFRAVMGELRAPVFLAGFDAGRSRLTIHVPSGYDNSALRVQAIRALDRVGESIRVSVRSHRLRKLAHPRSLEHWLRRFEIDQIIYDPTMVAARARDLLSAAAACRSELGDVIGGLFFDPLRRMVFVLNRGNIAAAAQSSGGERIRAVLDHASGGGRNPSSRPWHEVHVVTELPRREMIPIDAKSASLARGARRALGRWFAPLALALALAGVAVPASAKVDAQQVARYRIGGHDVAMRSAHGEFGILHGLSVFTDDARSQESGAFAAAGLQRYFGEGPHDAHLIRVAANHHHKRQRPSEPYGTVGSPGS